MFNWWYISFFFPTKLSKKNLRGKLYRNSFNPKDVWGSTAGGVYTNTCTEKIYMVWGNDAWSCHGQEVFLHSKDSQGALHSSPAAANNIAIQPTGLNMYQSQYRQFHLSKILQKLEFHERFKLGTQTVTHTCLKILSLIFIHAEMPTARKWTESDTFLKKMMRRLLGRQEVMSPAWRWSCAVRQPCGLNLPTEFVKPF